MDHRKLKVGVVGATGMVGKSFMETLEQRDFPVAELRPFASEKSAGLDIELMGKSYPIQTLTPGCFNGLDLVFFSSGDEISHKWAPLAAKAGAFAVDNSAAFRMDNQVPLVVPEVNGDILDQIKIKPQIIANPNCTTIQLVVALNPLYKKYGLKEVRVASYQAVSGAGQAAYDELVAQVKDSHQEPSVFPHRIAYNCIPQIGSFQDNGFTSEEIKVIKESRKILRHPQLKISSFTVRVPVLNAHAEAVWATLDKETSREEVIKTLEAGPGLVVEDNPQKSFYPQQYLASGQDPVYVGRIHRDLEDPKTWLMWVVADNVRKGAALNGIQIAERIFDI
ncbi:MAG: aspartate-semialdehyde dehydrogenase [Oligoflexia bacterium]|nr:MAG: aspartate-semialdehyde dehydrogenase [Oligoflexia bacterium]